MRPSSKGPRLLRRVYPNPTARKATNWTCTRGVLRKVKSIAICFGLLATTTLAAKPPNLVLIMADDLGYGHIGSYGQTKIETPNLDRMATEGIRFTAAYGGSTAFTRPGAS